MMIIITLSPWPSQRTSSVLMLLINLCDILANEADCKSDVPPCPTRLTEKLRQWAGLQSCLKVRINQQQSWWATNSLSAAEALKSVGKRLLLFSLEDYCSVTRRKKIATWKPKFSLLSYFSMLLGLLFLFLWGVPTLEGLEWFNISFGNFFSLRMTIYFPCTVPLPWPSVRLEEPGL